MLCPICRKSVTKAEDKPFCSARCKQIDLGKWLTESYAIPSESSVEIETVFTEDLSV